jgi:hypothetical protein
VANYFSDLEKTHPRVKPGKPVNLRTSWSALLLGRSSELPLNLLPIYVEVRFERYQALGNKGSKDFGA